MVITATYPILNCPSTLKKHPYFCEREVLLILYGEVLQQYSNKLCLITASPVGGQGREMCKQTLPRCPHPIPRQEGQGTPARVRQGESENLKNKRRKKVVSLYCQIMHGNLLHHSITCTSTTHCSQFICIWTSHLKDRNEQNELRQKKISNCTTLTGRGCITRLSVVISTNS